MKGSITAIAASLSMGYFAHLVHAGVVVATSAAIPSGCYTQNVNGFKNPSFESGLTSWSTGDAAGDEDYDHGAIGSGGAADGTYYFSMTGPDDWVYVKQDVKCLEPAMAYAVRAKYQLIAASTAATGDQCTLKMTVGSLSGATFASVTAVQQLPVQNAVFTWYTLQGTVTAPSVTDPSVPIFLAVTCNTAGGTINLDNFYLEKPELVCPTSSSVSSASSTSSYSSFSSASSVSSISSISSVSSVSSVSSPSASPTGGSNCRVRKQMGALSRT